MEYDSSLLICDPLRENPAHPTKIDFLFEVKFIRKMLPLEQWVSRPLDYKILAYKASTLVLQAQTHAISSYIQRVFAMHMECTINTNGVTSSCPVPSVHFTLSDLDSTG